MDDIDFDIEDELVDESDEAIQIFSTILKTPGTYELTDAEITKVKQAMQTVSDKIKEAEGNDAEIIEIDRSEMLAEVEKKPTTSSAFAVQGENRKSAKMVVPEDKDVEIIRTMIEDTEMVENVKKEAEDIDIVEVDEEVNEKHVSYESFIKPSKKFLKMRKVEPFVEIKMDHEVLAYPLGVVFDEMRREWVICEKSNKLLKINVSHVKSKRGVAAIEHDYIRNPSALTIFKEGRSVAVLCSKHTNDAYWISIFKFGAREGGVIHKYCSYTDKGMDLVYPCRGLSRTIGGNILTIDMPPAPRAPRLRILCKRQKETSFKLEMARRPSFISANGDRVAITDLGTQMVFLLKVDDSNWDNLVRHPDQNIQLLRVLDSSIYSLPRTPKSMCNVAGFNFVAGCQFDRCGNLMVGDAGGHSLKLFDKNLNFLHRVSSDFPIPYMSSFFMNRRGQCLMIDLRGRSKKFVFGQLCSTSQQLPWVETDHMPKVSERSRFSK